MRFVITRLTTAVQTWTFDQNRLLYSKIVLILFNAWTETSWWYLCTLPMFNCLHPLYYFSSCVDKFRMVCVFWRIPMIPFHRAVYWLVNSIPSISIYSDRYIYRGIFNRIGKRSVCFILELLRCISRFSKQYCGGRDSECRFFFFYQYNIFHMLKSEHRCFNYSRSWPESTMLGWWWSVMTLHLVESSIWLWFASLSRITFGIHDVSLSSWCYLINVKFYRFEMRIFL